MNKLLKTISMCLLLMIVSGLKAQVNDSNTPLHLMTPQYKLKYGISTVDEVKQTMDKVLHYIASVTPAKLVDSKTGKAVTNYADINENTQLARGDFRLTSYEWGVTYSAVLAAYQQTGDKAYKDYLYERLQFLADIQPYFKKIYQRNGRIDDLMRKVIDPHALDDAGAICEAMIKASLNDKALHLDSLINNYSSYIINKEYRLEDGTFARLRPHKNTIWLDDMFMGIPTVAYMGKYTGHYAYYDEAIKQIELFAKRMFVPEKNLFRHGWVEAMEDHPAYHWGRANGWAILTLCEVLDVLPEGYPGRIDVLDLLKAHIRGLAACQDRDGFWHQLLDR
ncbi:MAG: glycoside hydrolase family 88 protein, partial [Prevotella sp.]|nr:glycoside hydrolase family 88 protein [Prevotella sp.]